MNILKLVAGSILVANATCASARNAPNVTFFNVRIETMTDRPAISHGYVVVRGGRVTAVQAGNPPAHQPGRRIDGKGGTIMPGLADMHVHYNEDGMGPAFIANGITAVRNMFGGLEHARRDEAARTGALMGPRVYTSGPIINSGYFLRADNPDQAIGAVRSQAMSGYRAVKLYQNLSPAIFRAAVAEARINKMQVYCHVPLSMSVYEVLDLGVDSIEHLTGYGRILAQDGFRSTGTGAYDEDWASADPAKFAALAQRTAASATWMVPTFALTYGSSYSRDPEAYNARPEAAYVSPLLKSEWKRFAKNLEADRKYVEAGLKAKIAFMHALRNAGAKVLIGTDAGNPYVAPGFSIHDELRAFALAGYSNREILYVATVDAARFLGRDAGSGTVAVGGHGDLILLEGDPMKDLTVLRRPIGAMVNGFWYDRKAIAKALARVIATNRTLAAAQDRN